MRAGSAAGAAAAGTRGYALGSTPTTTTTHPERIDTPRQRHTQRQHERRTHSLALSFWVEVVPTKRESWRIGAHQRYRTHRGCMCTSEDRRVPSRPGMDVQKGVTVEAEGGREEPSRQKSAKTTTSTLPVSKIFSPEIPWCPPAVGIQPQGLAVPGIAMQPQGKLIARWDHLTQICSVPNHANPVHPSAFSALQKPISSGSESDEHSGG